MAMGRLSNRTVPKRASSQLAVALAPRHRFYDTAPTQSCARPSSIISSRCCVRIIMPKRVILRFRRDATLGCCLLGSVRFDRKRKDTLF